MLIGPNFAPEIRVDMIFYEVVMWYDMKPIIWNKCSEFNLLNIRIKATLKG